LAEGRTTLIIAHRLTTIRHASMICYLEQGEIVEKGSHAELLSAGGRYKKLLQAAGML
jgi:ABC-type multidrug transport system fused ATPase/permease subunit